MPALAETAARWVSPASSASAGGHRLDGDGIRDRLCLPDHLVVPQPAGERRSHVDHPHDRLRRLGAGSEGRLAGLSAQALSLDSGIVAEVGGPVGPRQRGRSNPHRQPGQLRGSHRAASRRAELAETLEPPDPHRAADVRFAGAESTTRRHRRARRPTTRSSFSSGRCPCFGECDSSTRCPGGRCSG